MRLTKSALRRKWLTYLLFVLALGTLLIQQSIVLSREHRLASARSNWAMRPFSRYRLLIEENNGSCQQEVEVSGENVVANLGNTCRINLRTVNSLFRLIEGTPPTIYSCVALGCACDTVLSTYTQYDRQLGYPREITFEWSSRANLHHPDYWKHLIITGLPPHCRSTPFRRTIRVRSVAPLQ